MPAQTRPRWRRSSYSSNQANCVEAAALGTDWTRSSYSTDTGNCVEVTTGAATSGATVVGVRDSKDPHGPVLAVSATHWAAFVRALPQH